MPLRVQLINDFLGPLTIEENDPIDINAIVQTIKRSEEHDGVIYEVVLDIEFIKQSRRYLKQAYELYGGIDAVVICNLYEYDSNRRRWDIAFEGQVNFQKFDLSEDKLAIAIEQTGFQRRVLNLLDVDVNLQTTVTQGGFAMPPDPTIDVNLHSKAILKESIIGPSNNLETLLPDAIIFSFGACEIGPCDRPRDGTVYGTIDTSKQTLNELATTFTYPWGILTDAPLEVLRIDPGNEGVSDVFISVRTKIDLVVNQFGTNNDIDVTSPCSSDAPVGNREFTWWYEQRDLNGAVKFQAQFAAQTSINGCGGGISIGDNSWKVEGEFEQFNYNLSAQNFAVGDRIFVYPKFRIHGTYELPGTTPSCEMHHDIIITPDMNNTFIRFVSNTKVSEAPVKGVLIHEAFERICQYYTDQIICFKSNLLGRTDIGYSSNGEFSEILVTNGDNIRGRQGRNIFISFNKLLEFVNMIACVGYGFEKLETGEQILRLEKKEYFYDANTNIFSFGKVYNVKRRVLGNRYYNSIEYGYVGKLDVESVNAIDEFNTIRRQKIPINNTKNQLKVGTTIKTSGYQIENLRRMVFSTEDTNQDTEIFAIVVINNGMGGWQSKKNEGYEQINNVFEAATGYNYDLSPGQVKENWKRFLASGVIRSANKICSFNYGEINYKMSTKKIGGVLIEEDGNIDLTGVAPLWDNEIYYFTAPMTKQQADLLKKQSLGIMDLEDAFGEVLQGFLYVVEYDSEKKQAQVELLKKA